MEQVTTFHIGEKVRSYTIIFKLEVVDFAEEKSIAGAPFRYQFDDSLNYDSSNYFSSEKIRKSFKVCALTSAIDGSENERY